MPVAIRVTPWPDPVLDVLGHDPRSWYAETFWLPTLGPTALLLMRHLADRFEQTPDGRRPPGRRHRRRARARPARRQHSPLMRSLTRLQQFELACRDDETTIAVRRALPPVHRRHVRRLPAALQARHAEWVAEPDRRAGRARAPPGAPRCAHARRAGRADRHRRARAAHRRLPSRARARSGALGAASSSTTSPIPPPERSQAQSGGPDGCTAFADDQGRRSQPSVPRDVATGRPSPVGSGRAGAGRSQSASHPAAVLLDGRVGPTRDGNRRTRRSRAACTASAQPILGIAGVR